MTKTGNWRPVSVAAGRLGVSSRFVLYLIDNGDIKAKRKGKAKHSPWLAYWPDVVRYDEGRDTGESRRSKKSA